MSRVENEIALGWTYAGETCPRICREIGFCGLGDLSRKNCDLTRAATSRTTAIRNIDPVRFGQFEKRKVNSRLTLISALWMGAPEDFRNQRKDAASTKGQAESGDAEQLNACQSASTSLRDSRSRQTWICKEFARAVKGFVDLRR